MTRVTLTWTMTASMIRSSARRLGPSAPKAVLGVYVLAFLLALACAFTARLGPLFPPLAAGYGLHLSRQAARLDMGDPAGALALFRSNALAGLILFAALAAGRFGQGLWGGGGL